MPASSGSTKVPGHLRRSLPVPAPPAGSGTSARWLDWLLLVVALAPVLTATVESHRAGASLRWLLTGTGELLVAACGALAARAGPRVLAGLCVVATCTLATGAPFAGGHPALVLCGRDQEFWG